MAATVRWSTRATRTTSPQGGVGWVPCASLRNEPHCMWRLETVTLLKFSQHSQGWNSALLQGWSYNSSLFYALYCIYSNTSLSSLSVLQQRWILWSHVSVSFTRPLHLWTLVLEIALVKQVDIFHELLKRGRASLLSATISRSQEVKGDSPVKALKRPCPRMLLVPRQRVWTASKRCKSPPPSV